MKKIYLIVPCVLSLLLGIIFSGFHTFICVIVGFAWTYALFHIKGFKDHIMLGKFKMSYNRYSFIKFVKNIDGALNRQFNPKDSWKVGSALRVLQPSLFFILLNSLMVFRVEWYFVLLGAIAFEGLEIFQKWQKEAI